MPDTAAALPTTEQQQLAEAVARITDSPRG
jgi:hypothetical protein